MVYRHWLPALVNCSGYLRGPPALVARTGFLRWLKVQVTFAGHPSYLPNGFSALITHRVFGAGYPPGFRRWLPALVTRVVYRHWLPEQVTRAISWHWLGEQVTRV